LAIEIITKQKGILTFLKKNNVNFFLKKKSHLGCKVTLRKNFLYLFLENYYYFNYYLKKNDKLSFNYNIGIENISFFYEIKIFEIFFLKKIGLDIIFYTNYYYLKNNNLLLLNCFFF